MTEDQGYWCVSQDELTAGPRTIPATGQSQPLFIYLSIYRSVLLCSVTFRTQMQIRDGSSKCSDGGKPEDTKNGQNSRSLQAGSLAESPRTRTSILLSGAMRHPWRQEKHCERQSKNRKTPGITLQVRTIRCGCSGAAALNTRLIAIHRRCACH